MPKGLSDTLHDKLGDFFHQAKTLPIHAMKSITHSDDSYCISKAWVNDELLKDIEFSSSELPDVSTTFALYCLTHLTKDHFDIRLIVCYDTFHQIHCICEVTDKSHSSSYYLDYLCSGIVSEYGLIGYYFLVASPWNPTNESDESWVPLNREAS